MKYIALLVTMVLAGCSTLENKMMDIQIESGATNVTIIPPVDTADENWTLVLVMMNPTGHIITIPVENYPSLERCLEMYAEYSLQVPDQDKTQQLLCLLNNSTIPGNEIPELLKPQPEPVEFIGPLELEDRGIMLQVASDDII